MKPSSRRNGRLPLLALLALALAPFGCTNLPISHAPAIDRAELVKSAMFDHDCPAEGIHVLRADSDPMGTARFVLDVCGTKRTYKRIGTMYFDADRKDPLG